VLAVRFFRPPVFERTLEWRQAQLRSIASGDRTTSLGVRHCHCSRRWTCHRCGEPFTCWNVWPFLWKAIPASLHDKKLCRRCYGIELLAELGATPPQPASVEVKAVERRRSRIRARR
jgi:hypothetical protein